MRRILGGLDEVLPSLFYQWKEEEKAEQMGGGGGMNNVLSGLNECASLCSTLAGLCVQLILVWLSLWRFILVLLYHLMSRCCTFLASLQWRRIFYPAILALRVPSVLCTH
jgi:hypothetical protein